MRQTSIDEVNKYNAESGHDLTPEEEKVIVEAMTQENEHHGLERHLIRTL